MHVEVARPTAAEQQSLWTDALKGVDAGIHARISEIVQQFDFGPEAIPDVARAAMVQARLRAQPAGFSADDLWAACRDHTCAQLGTLAERIEPGYAWDDIVLPDDVLRQVRELGDQVAARAQVYERWGFAKRFARGRGIAALFSGPSGTGKTMTAEILARHLGLDLYRIDLAGVVSKYIGETEKNLRSIFDAAEQSGAILFFDEADALFGKRAEVRDSHDRFANIEINYLLQRMEDYRGLAILCTNRRSALDRAFLRRLRFVIEFPFPDAEHRRRIWQKMFPPAAPLGTLDFNALARLEVPGGNIRNIAINAAFLAAGAREPIAEAHVLQAARREYAKIDKLVTAAEFGSAPRTVQS
jgi:SpoVK/Ycf46/Vps4 family AAA+-type ATPase